MGGKRVRKSAAGLRWGTVLTLIAGAVAVWIWRSDSGVQQWGYRVIAAYPHDTAAYTQGLLFHEGHFFESTGGEGRSSLRKVSPETGVVLQKKDLPADIFGEGLALWKNRLYQLTWKNRMALLYDLDSFEKLGEYTYPGEGWGLAGWEQGLVMSDGSDRLYLMDPEAFQATRVLNVTLNGEPLNRLNELEWIKGRIWANVYGEKRIACISADSGRVEALIDFAGLPLPEHRTGREDVFNGIAHDPIQDRIFVTGKNWSRVYEIELTAPKRGEPR